jgi:hypothetical protein
VNHPARSMLQSHKHIEESKTGSHRDDEVASDNGSSVVPEESRPTLIAARPVGQPRPATSADCPPQKLSRWLEMHEIKTSLSRRIVHANVTAHPTAAWTMQQLREAIPSDHVTYGHRKRRNQIKQYHEQRDSSVASDCPR